MGGKCMLFVDGKQVAEGHIPKTVPFIFSGDEGTNVGLDAETAVSDDYKQEGNTFIGTIVKVTIDVSPPKMNAADQKALDDAEDAAELAGDCPYADPVADA
jgi:arylsulfatase